MLHLFILVTNSGLFSVHEDVLFSHIRLCHSISFIFVSPLSLSLSHDNCHVLDEEDIFYVVSDTATPFIVVAGMLTSKFPQFVLQLMCFMLLND